MASAEQNLHKSKGNNTAENAELMSKGNNTASLNYMPICKGNNTLHDNNTSVNAISKYKRNMTLNTVPESASPKCKGNNSHNTALVNAMPIHKITKTLHTESVNSSPKCKGKDTPKKVLVNAMPDVKPSRSHVARPDTPIAPPFVPFVPNQPYHARQSLDFHDWRKDVEPHPRTLLLDAIALVEGEYGNTGTYLPELGANDQASGAAPMFAGMRGVHGQMLPGSSLGGPSIPGLGGFGLSASLPSLPPDRKVYSTPPPTPLPTLPSPNAGTPTTPTTSAYYDHMKY